jgi:hypothetical protein
MTEKYCESEHNLARCAWYKLLESGIYPLVELLPDGKFFLRGLLLKKEIVIE